MPISWWAVQLWLNILGHPVPVLIFTEDHVECKQVEYELRDYVGYDQAVPRCFYLGTVKGHTTSILFNTEPELEAIWFNPYWRGY